MLVEVMGRRAGWIALNAGLASVSHDLIPEQPSDIEEVHDWSKAVSSVGLHFICVVAEGAKPAWGRSCCARVVSDEFGHVLTGVAAQLAVEVEKRINKDIRDGVKYPAGWYSDRLRPSAGPPADSERRRRRACGRVRPDGDVGSGQTSVGSAGGCGSQLQTGAAEPLRRRRRLLRLTSGASNQIAAAAGAAMPQGAELLDYDEVVARFPAGTGLEVHVESSTATKMFCGCTTTLAASQTPRCVRCLGSPARRRYQPGRQESAIRIGLALNCDRTLVSLRSGRTHFTRHVPRTTRSSQYDEPDRHQRLPGRAFEDGTTWRVEIERAHMEEDTGKLTHIGSDGPDPRCYWLPPTKPCRRAAHREIVTKPIRVLLGAADARSCDGVVGFSIRCI